ncbi:4a-hydroxytetrahydrobiopterin dehydratase [Nanohaloarchaea archaeon H01]|nr:4a-hydroxytetrahydrobiopterin dehydratase [Nanohaloarchaea archaeon H01]
MTETLTDEELDEALGNLQIWGIEAGKLATRVEFEDYKETVFFANTVFSLAEEEFHHPEVTVEYGAIEIDLWSHEEKGITGKDIDMAEEIEKRLGKMN